jgi:hypothetical protein
MPQTKEQRKKSYQQHKEKRRAYMKAYREAGGEEYKQRQREYGRVYREKHRVELKAYLKKYNQEYYPLHKEEVNNRSKAHHRANKMIVLSHYGTKCACCGESEIMFLTIDHVNNDGAKHRKEMGSGSKTYKWLIDNNFPEGFQTLCYNCNCGRRHDVCPHKRKEELNGNT